MIVQVNVTEPGQISVIAIRSPSRGQPTYSMKLMHYPEVLQESKTEGQIFSLTPLKSEILYG